MMPMKTKHVRLLLAALPALACMLAFLACSKAPELAGATSETTNGDLKASVQRADGTPAARTRVLLVDDEDWLGKIAEGSSVKLDSAVTDDSGGFQIRLPKAHRCNLQIDDTAQGAFLRGVNAALPPAATSSALLKITLAPYGRVSGRIHSDNGDAREIRLAGTTYAAVINADSGYVFSQVPAGSFAIVAMVDRNGLAQPFLARSFDLAPGASLVDQDLGVSASRILVDDFESGWKQTALGRILGQGLWYTLTDSVEKGNSSVKADVVSGSEAYSGSSVRTEYVLGSKLHVAWAIMGFQIGTALSGNAYDFSNLTAISFWAKGKGNIDVRCMSRAITSKYADSAQYFYTVRLQPGWTHVTIPVDSLRLPSFASPELQAITWAQAAKEMQALDFTVEAPQMHAGDTAVFWLDEVYFQGLSLKDLAP